MKLTPWMVLLCLGLVACSGSKSAQKVDEEAPEIQLSDADEFLDNPAEAPAGDAMEADPMAADSGGVTEEPIISEATNEVDELAAPMAPASAPVKSSQSLGTTKTYTVKKNETLMLIAFKLYGDYEKWKQLATTNQDTLKGNASVREGMVLKYDAPAEDFVWNPEGSPYLIRTGDTLGVISNNVYKTKKKWKLLWENNRPLIKDPNRIFAGFTLYYVEDGRGVAAEK